MTHPITSDQAVGALIGMALGDALGFLVAGESPSYCGDFARLTLSDDDPPWLERDGFAFGQYGVDTQLARELALALTETRGFDPTRYARRVGDLIGDRRAVGAGVTTTAAGGRLALGMVWAQSGEPAPAAGNGAAIRAVPLGLAFQAREHRLGAADLQAMITHHDARARAAAQCVAEAVHLAATTEPDAATWCPHLADLVDRAAPRLASGLRTLDRALSQPADQAVALLAPAGHDPADGYPLPDRIAGAAIPTLLFGLQAFLRTPDDPLAALQGALSGGGDTASLGALVGALAGARLGYARLPARLRAWGAHLNDRGGARQGELAALAQRLVTR